MAFPIDVIITHDDINYVLMIKLNSIIIPKFIFKENNPQPLKAINFFIWTKTWLREKSSWRCKSRARIDRYFLLGVDIGQVFKALY